MKEEEYKKLVDKLSPKEDIFKDIFISFITGGSLGLLGQLLSNYYMTIFNVSVTDSYLFVFISYIIIGSVLTGIGVFDKILSICKCGFIVPSTGFANSMTSAAMDYRKEGLIYGFGSNMFKLAGSVILYGVVSAWFFGMIRYVIGVMMG